MIRRQIVMPVDAERLWDAITDPEQLEGWFGVRVEWELSEGAPAVFEEPDGTLRYGQVETVRPGRHLRFRWWRADGGEESEVSYLLEPVEGGTRLTVQERRTHGGEAWASTASGWPASGWSVWDGRLAGAWAGLASRARV